MYIVQAVNLSLLSALLFCNIRYCIHHSHWRFVSMISSFEDYLYLLKSDKSYRPDRCIFHTSNSDTSVCKLFTTGSLQEPCKNCRFFESKSDEELRYDFDKMADQPCVVSGYDGHHLLHLDMIIQECDDPDIYAKLLAVQNESQSIPQYIRDLIQDDARRYH